jgi:hypothetical protein
VGGSVVLLVDVDELDGSVTVVDVVGGNIVGGNVVDGTVVDGGAVDVVVVAGATPVSGDTHPAGGVVVPD